VYCFGKLSIGYNVIDKNLIILQHEVFGTRCLSLSHLLIEAMTGNVLSASAPIFAAIISLLNNACLPIEQAPLGYLNPWLCLVGQKGRLARLLREGLIFSLACA
jgi:hypothetical protein